MTWYPQSYLAKVPMTNMGLRPDPSTGYPGRTYRFYKGPVVFPFGFGLSYSKFSQSFAEAPTKISLPLSSLSPNSSATVKVSHTDCASVSDLPIMIDVKNTGTVDGSHTTIVFSTAPNQIWSYLIGFEKVHIMAWILEASSNRNYVKITEK